jgi:hypothetical protein
VAGMVRDEYNAKRCRAIKGARRHMGKRSARVWAYSAA